eukprot:2649018-Prymnesium_polylepis.1
MAKAALKATAAVTPQLDERLRVPPVDTMDALPVGSERISAGRAAHSVDFTTGDLRTWSARRAQCVKVAAAILVRHPRRTVAAASQRLPHNPATRARRTRAPYDVCCPSLPS